jgi:hypothetical protein
LGGTFRLPDKPRKQAGQERNEVVSENIRDDRPLIDKYNMQLENAKGQTRKSDEEINPGKARAKELS